MIGKLKSLFKKSNVTMVESPLTQKVGGTLAPHIIEREAMREERAKRQARALRSLGTVPNDGYAWNPLLKVERNAKCPCGSGVKFKRCHLDKLPKAVTEKQAEVYEKAMRAPGGVTFVTKENQAAMAEQGRIPNDNAGKDEAR